MAETHSFGYWVRRRRKALDLTQDALARQVGCALGTLKKIETDERRPSRQLAARLADCLAIPSAERAAFLKAARAELAAESWREMANAPRAAYENRDYERWVAAARAQLDEATFAAAWAAGRAMTIEEAIAYTLGEEA